MIFALLSVVAIFLFLVFVEFITRNKNLRGEASRKLVHIGVGSFIAFWPFFMPIKSILLLCIALFAVIFVSKTFHIFQSIHTVRRFTNGELFFPTGIALSALLTNSKWIFLAAILHMSLADGLAGLIGMGLEKAGRYTVFGRVKTIAGSLTFLVVSILITGWVVIFSPAGFSSTAWPVIIWLPPMATLLENISPDGSDNLLVPLLVVSILSLIPII